MVCQQSITLENLPNTNFTNPLAVQLFCGTPMVETPWTPPPGFDQRLREFWCPQCGNRQYDRVTESHIKDAELVRIQ